MWQSAIRLGDVDEELFEALQYVDTHFALVITDAKGTQYWHANL